MRRILLHSETRDRKFLLLEQLIDLLNLNASDVAVSDFEFVSRELASEGIEVAALDKAWKKYMRFGVDDEKRAILMSLFDTFAELNISWQEFFDHGKDFTDALASKEPYVSVHSALYFAPTKANITNTAYEGLKFQRFWNYDFAQYVCAPNQSLLVLRKDYWSKSKQVVLATLNKAQLCSVGKPVIKGDKTVVWYMPSKEYTAFVAGFGVSFWGLF